MNKVILLAANRGYALLSSRQKLIEKFLSDGWQVVLATAEDDEAQSLVALGAVLEPVVFNRGGFSPLTDWQAWQRLRQIVRRWRPSLVHFFHAKPVIMGTIAARRELENTVHVVNTITGLGHAFIRGGFVAFLASAGFRKALSQADITIFQNRDDRALFLDKKWLPEEKSVLISGSGIPLERFTYMARADHDQSCPVVIMLGRLLNQKGIPEFVEVANRVKQDLPRAQFLWAGEEDPVHPDAVDIDWLKNQRSVSYLGRLPDVRSLLNQADLLLFPSYREGVPRSVMEAAATGLATVAFDVPGVREAVRDGETGYLVCDRDVDAMTDRVLQLLQDKAQRIELGRNACEFAKEAFDIRVIQEAYLNVYRDLGVEI